MEDTEFVDYVLRIVDPQREEFSMAHLLDPAMVRCSFCGKDRNEVSRLFTRPRVYVCAECVEWFHDLIQNEQRGSRQHDVHRRFVDRLVDAARNGVPRLLTDEVEKGVDLDSFQSVLEGLDAHSAAVVRRAVACAAEIGIVSALKTIQVEGLSLVQHDGLKLLPIGKTAYSDFVARLLGRSWPEIN
jgi:hypothetical protein